jgi:hypothetical protein
MLPEVLDHQAFKVGPVNFLGRIERAAGAVGPKDAGVEVELIAQLGRHIGMHRGFCGFFTMDCMDDMDFLWTDSR